MKRVDIDTTYMVKMRSSSSPLLIVMFLHILCIAVQMSFSTSPMGAYVRDLDKKSARDKNQSQFCVANNFSYE